MSGRVGLTPERARQRAIIGTVIAIVITAAAWIALARAADYGVERVGRIDRARAWCDSLYRTASFRADSDRVDRVALADTIDPGSDQQFARCGDLRLAASGAVTPGAPRDMPQRLSPEAIDRPRPSR